MKNWEYKLLLEIEDREQRYKKSRKHFNTILQKYLYQISLINYLLKRIEINVVQYENKHDIILRTSTMWNDVVLKSTLEESLKDFLGINATNVYISKVLEMQFANNSLGIGYVEYIEKQFKKEIEERNRKKSNFLTKIRNALKRI